MDVTDRPILHFVTIKAAAEVLGVHRQTVERMIRAGELAVVNVGRTRPSFRIDIADIHALKALRSPVAHDE